MSKNRECIGGNKGYFLKLGVVFVVFFAFQSYAADGSKGPSCQLFFAETKPQARIENGHNVPLRQVMFKMKEYQDIIEGFANGLNPASASKYLPDRSAEFRNLEALESVLTAAHKFQKILDHLVEHAADTMITARIESVPADQRARFTEQYKKVYVDYAQGFQKVVVILENMKSTDPKSWDNSELKNVLMGLHTQMGAAHNKF